MIDNQSVDVDWSHEYELIKNKTADSVFYPQCAMPDDDKIISLLSTFEYWENGLYDSDEKIDIELGDGQVAEYFGNTGLSTFYKAISEVNH